MKKVTILIQQLPVVFLNSLITFFFVLFRMNECRSVIIKKFIYNSINFSPFCATVCAHYSLYSQIN